MKNFDTLPSPKIPDEKIIKLDEARNKVDKIADSEGRVIDEGIKKCVTALMMHGFPTDDSCEGHLSDEPGRKKIALPRIGVNAPEPEGWKESEEKQKKLSEENAIYKKRMKELLEEFYADQKIADEYRLIIHKKGKFNRFVIASTKDMKAGLNPGENEKDILDRARLEIADFTNFLMDKFRQQ